MRAPPFLNNFITFLEKSRRPYFTKVEPKIILKLFLSYTSFKSTRRPKQNSNLFNMLLHYRNKAKTEQNNNCGNRCISYHIAWKSHLFCILKLLKYRRNLSLDEAWAFIYSWISLKYQRFWANLMDSKKFKKNLRSKSNLRFLEKSVYLYWRKITPLNTF